MTTGNGDHCRHVTASGLTCPIELAIPPKNAEIPIVHPPNNLATNLPPLSLCSRKIIFGEQVKSVMVEEGDLEVGYRDLWYPHRRGVLVIFNIFVYRIFPINVPKSFTPTGVLYLGLFPRTLKKVHPGP